MPLSDDDILSSWQPGTPPPPDAFAPQSGSDDILDSFMASRAAKAKAAGALDTNPDVTAKSLNIAKKTGIPSQIVATDPETFKKQGNLASADKALSNPHIQRYVNEVPNAAELSSDDWEAMMGVSQSLDWLDKDGHKQATTARMVANSPASKAVMGWANGFYEGAKHDLGVAWQGFRAGYDGQPVSEQIADAMDKYGGPGTSKMFSEHLADDVNMIEALLRAPGAVIGGAGALTGEELIRLGVPEALMKMQGITMPIEQARESFRQQFGEAVGVASIVPAGDFAPQWKLLPKVKPDNISDFIRTARTFQDKAEINEFMRQQATGKWDPSAFAGNPDLQREVATRMEADGFKPIEPSKSLVVWNADTAARSMDRAVEAAQGSKTRERSPEVFEQFLDKKSPDIENSKVYLPAEDVLKLYQAAKKGPSPGDGILGFVPDLAKKLQLASEVPSREIAIPLAKYIANIDPAIHEKLREVLRLHDDGSTLEEAKIERAKEPLSEVDPDVVERAAVMDPASTEHVLPPHLKGAAIKYEDEIFRGENHGEALKALQEKHPDLDPQKPLDQGWVTNHNRYLSREEAFDLHAPRGEVDFDPANPDDRLLESGNFRPLAQPAEGPIHKEIKAEAAVEAAQKAEAQAKAEGKVPEEEVEKSLIEPEAKAPAKAEELAPAKEEIEAKTPMDVRRSIQIFGGNMYDMPNIDRITVKELMQNSFDALKSMIEKGVAKNPNIDITMDANNRTITVKDNGSGMRGDQLAGPFLTIAGTEKETDRPSGGFGIAKMLFLHGNEGIKVTTLRDGKISKLVSNGAQIMKWAEDPENNKLVISGNMIPSKADMKLFPDGHGTIVEVKIPESFRDTDGEHKQINFRDYSFGHQEMRRSPLFDDIAVKFNGETVPIGKNFPYNDYTTFANAKFDWGTARIYVSKDEEKIGYGDNVHVLSNGIYQFSTAIKKDPKSAYGESIPRTLYVDINSKAKPADAAYPFDRNRMGFTKRANEDLKKIMNYVWVKYQQSDLAAAVSNFGDIQYYDEQGRAGARVKLQPVIPPKETGFKTIDEGADVEIKNGEMRVKGKKVPDLTPDQLASTKIDVDELMVDPKMIDPNRVMLHDNIEVWTGKERDLTHEGLLRQFVKGKPKDEGEYRSLVDLGREKFGARFDEFNSGVGKKFMELRNVVSHTIAGYEDLRKEGLGISFDQQYRGVSIRVPFNASFLNPAVPVEFDPPHLAAFYMTGTMIHEFAHHQVRSHDAAFPAEMQHIYAYLDALEYEEGRRITLDKPFFSLVKFKEELANHVQKYQDVLAWLNEKVTNRGTNEAGEPLVRNRGKRFQGTEHAVEGRDGGVAGVEQEPAAAVPSGYESLRPTFQSIDEGPGPEGFSKQLENGRELTDEERAVRDNPIATNAVIATKRAKRELYLDPLLTKGKTLNIDQSMYKDYSNLIEKSQLHILTNAIGFAHKWVSKLQSAEWAEEEAKLRPEVEREVLNQPAWLADRFFNWDKGMLPSGTKISPAPKMEGVRADEWAAIFGFDTGSQMSSAVLALEQERKDAGKGPKWQLKQHVDAEVTKRMEAKHGSLQDNIALEASSWALAAWNTDLLIQEIKMLAAAHNVSPPLTREDLNLWLKEQFGKQVASEVSYTRDQRATEKAGKEVEKALLKDKIRDALEHAQERVKAYVLAQEAKKFEKELAKDKRLINKYAKADVLKNVKQEYTDQIQSLLKSVGTDIARDDRSLSQDLQGVKLATFIAGKKAQGFDIVEAELPAKNSLEEFTVDEYRDFMTMLKSLDHNGRREQVFEVRNRIENENKVLDELAKNLDALEKKDFDPDAKGAIASLRRRARYIDSKLIKVERVADWIDQNDPNGVVNRVIFRPVIEGEQQKGDMLTTLANKAAKMPADREWSHSLNDPVDNRELYDEKESPYKPKVMNREQMISVALNYGNQGNRDVMLAGFKWRANDVEAFLKRNMTPKDWQMVNALHDLFSPLAPHVERVTRERTGVSVPLIEPTPYMDSKGGYFPLLPDPADRQIGAQTDTDLFDKIVYDPLPSAPALKRRTGKAYRLDLSLSYLDSVIERTTHAVFMQQPITQAWKLINTPIMQQGLTQAFGPEYFDMFRLWARDVANNGGGDSGNLMRSWVSHQLRRNIVTFLMGYKVSTALIHGASAGFSSAYELSKIAQDEGAIYAGGAELAKNMLAMKGGLLPKFLQETARRLFGDQPKMLATIDEVMAESGEMRNRQRSLLRDFGFQMTKVLRMDYKDDLAYWRDIYQNYSMALVGYTDLLSAMPVYIGYRDHALAMGAEREDAIYAAEKAVREAHGSASLVSRANIGRNSELEKLFTIAYMGYWNHNYNKLRSEFKTILQPPPPRPPTGPGHDLMPPGGPGDDEPHGPGIDTRIALGAAFLTAFIVAPMLVHDKVRGEKHKTVKGAAGSMLLSQLAGTVPVVNELSYSIVHNRDPSMTPFADVLNTAYNIWADAEVRKHPKRQIAHLLQGGAMLGFPPTRQMIDTGSFVSDVLHGRKQPDVADWVKGVLAIGERKR